MSFSKSKSPKILKEVEKEWLLDIGIIEKLSNQPLNRLHQPASLAPTNEIPIMKKNIDSLDLSHLLTLETLQAELLAFDDFPLKKTALNIVFGDGNPKAEIMLIGEAPGADEDRQGKPFVGMSGQLLTKMFEYVGLNRSTDLYVSNIIPWRPPGNRQPTTQEIAKCVPFIRRHIELIAPKIVILVGGTAIKALAPGQESITKSRGKWFSYNSSGLTDSIDMMSIYHPAYLLRSPSRKRDVWVDLLTIKQKLLELT